LKSKVFYSVDNFLIKMDKDILNKIKKIAESYEAFPSLEEVRESMSQEIVQIIIESLYEQGINYNEISIELAFDENSGKPIAIRINRETCNL